MSTFITIDDYEVARTLRILELITEGDYSLIDKAEITALGIITDRLSELYDLTAELAKTKESRNASLLRWVLALSLYSLYDRTPDSEVPERVIKNYDDTISELEKIQQGKLSCSLQRKTVAATGEIKTRFRMGADTPRTHDPYSLG